MEKKSFAQVMLMLARRNSISAVFTDFLEMAVCALTLGAMEERYLEIVGRYEKKEAQQMAEAFGALVMEMDNRGEGLKDVFGEFFMEHISHGHNGQFFTPEPICEMMARVAMEEPTEEDLDGRPPRIADCACGSGRTLMAAAKINRNAMFYGADVDKNCAMMSVINFCLNGMLGEVAWMDSLTNRFYGAWQIRRHPSGMGVYVVPVKEEDSVMVLRLPEEVKENKDLKEIKEVKDFKEDFFDELLNNGSEKKVEQLSLF